MGSITIPRVDEVVARILPALQSVFGPHLRAAIVTGSAIKGDFIPYYSDLDIHAFVDHTVLMDENAPRADLALAFQEAIGGLEPGEYGFGSFQIIFVSADYRADWAPHLPETYQSILGDARAIFGDLSPARFIAHASRRLDQLPGEISTLVRTIVDKPDRSLERLSRLLGVYLKGQIYNAAVVITGDPLRVWQSRLDEVIPLLEPVASPALRAFFSGVRSWTESRGDPEYHRTLIHDGLQAMSDLAAWWAAAKERANG
ncbi:MAG: hypothetical protein ACRDIC_03505 [bacterium]